MNAVVKPYTLYFPFGTVNVLCSHDVLNGFEYGFPLLIVRSKLLIETEDGELLSGPTFIFNPKKLLAVAEFRTKGQYRSPKQNG